MEYKAYMSCIHKHNLFHTFTLNFHKWLTNQMPTLASSHSAFEAVFLFTCSARWLPQTFELSNLNQTFCFFFCFLLYIVSCFTTFKNHWELGSIKFFPNIYSIANRKDMELYHPVEHKHCGIELLATEKNVSMSIVILNDTWSMTKKFKDLSCEKLLVKSVSALKHWKIISPQQEKLYSLFHSCICHYAHTKPLSGTEDLVSFRMSQERKILL